LLVLANPLGIGFQILSAATKGDMAGIAAKGQSLNHSVKTISQPETVIKFRDFAQPDEQMTANRTYSLFAFFATVAKDMARHFPICGPSLRKQAIADRRCNALKLNDNDRVHQ
jgi:hypothetical protein